MWYYHTMIQVFLVKKNYYYVVEASYVLSRLSL